MQLEKVKHKDGETIIEWKTPNENDREAHVLQSKDEPEAAFTDALAALKADALGYLRLTDDEEDEEVEAELTTVNIRRDIHGNLGFLFSVRRKVPGGTHSVTTHRLREPTEDSDPDSPVVLSEEQMKRLDELKHQAIRYIQGHRSQGEIEFPKDDEPTEPFPDKEAA